ncbi:MAG: phosphoribosylamine--glycine ligase [Alphaproteobacteria bacterium]|nr:phosphoribosylamine--glycine ligase [Alphaproteobacteria bacterium]
MTTAGLKILVVGGGGRESALIWKIRQSPLVGEIFCAPGIPSLGHICHSIDIKADEVSELVAFAVARKIDFVVVGPETALVAGLIDELAKVGIAGFGPSKAAAILEGSKGFMKDFCTRHNIPTAAYRRFTDRHPAHKFIEDEFYANPNRHFVIKTDGLAAGKGVTVCNTSQNPRENRDMAHQAIDEAMLARKFSTAGQEIIIEECLVGEEISFFALCDGKNAIPFGAAIDHKRAYDHDLGANTGGMGAVSSPNLLSQTEQDNIMQRIILPTLTGMATEGREFRGILFAGLMRTADDIKLLEFNVRFGDPECQCLMMRLQSDLLPILMAASQGQLPQNPVKFSPQTSICVVMAQSPYPEPVTIHGEIHGLEKIQTGENFQLFHAATINMTDINEPNPIYQARGGRVLGVTCRAADIATAREMAYHELGKIDFPQGFYRKDIGQRLLRKV